MQTLTITRPDDWHCHLRDNAFLHRTVKDTATTFSRAIVMPNLTPPITSLTALTQYRSRILACNETGHFTPLMTLYLNKAVTPDMITSAHRENLVTACKLYPQGATTNSAAGVRDTQSLYPVLEQMQSVDMPLLVHGETPAHDIDIFDREQHFILNTLTQLIHDFPSLRIVLEHISTRYAVDFVTQAPSNVAATITPHHLLLNRNDILAGGIKPHHYCLPIAKREEDRAALLTAATSGNPKFFLGTDSAPHAQDSKESACGCAGIYSAYHAIPLYLEAFEQAGALDQFNAFASQFGANFYGLPVNTTQLTFIRKPWTVPETLSFGDTVVVPLWATQTLQWQLLDE